MSAQAGAPSRAEWAMDRRIAMAERGLSLRDSFFVLKRWFRENQAAGVDARQRLRKYRRALACYQAMSAAARLELVRPRRRVEDGIREMEARLEFHCGQRDLLLPALERALVAFDRGGPSWREVSEWLGVSHVALEEFRKELRLAGADLTADTSSALAAALCGAEAFGGRCGPWVVGSVAQWAMSRLIEADPDVRGSVDRMMKDLAAAAAEDAKRARRRGLRVVDGGVPTHRTTAEIPGNSRNQRETDGL